MGASIMDRYRNLIEIIRNYRNGDRYFDYEYHAFKIARNCVDLRVDELLELLINFIDESTDIEATIDDMEGFTDGQDELL